MEQTVRMTVAQAIVKFLDNQYVSMDGVETKFVEGFFTIFGHGIAVGLGEALDSDPGQLRVMQGRNEQGMCHAAIAFAKQNNRRRIIPCASSVRRLRSITSLCWCSRQTALLPASQIRCCSSWSRAAVWLSPPTTRSSRSADTGTVSQGRR